MTREILKIQYYRENNPFSKTENENNHEKYFICVDYDSVILKNPVLLWK